jgi:hypothetical protein
MNKKFEIIKNKLITNEFEKNFEYDVKKVEYLDGIYIVLLDIPNDCNEIDNIFGVDISGRAIWRIENPSISFPTEKTGNPEFDNLTESVYVGLIVNQEKEIYAVTFWGIKYKFNYKTGKLIEKEVSRW